jgi:N-acetyl-1-D-myo-inositol-2-amino-2-deoxy-alpha-D-glucopyranoside deacetylase
MVWGATGPEPLASLTDDSLCAAEFGEVAADLAAVIDQVRPSAVISYDENGGYGHPDHVRAHQAARRAAAVKAIPFFVVDEDPSDSTLAVDVHPVLSRKREALRSHRTQVVVEGDRFALSSGPSRPIAAVEGFSRRLETAPGALPWKDQGAGVHIMAYLLAFVVGVVIGGISVVNHQFSPQIGGQSIPVGITIVLLIVGALFAGLRMVFPGRLVVGCAAVGLLGVIALLSVASDGGSVLVPANYAGYLLTYGPLVLAVIALAWPAAGTFSRDRLVTKL